MLLVANRKNLKAAFAEIVKHDYRVSIRGLALAFAAARRSYKRKLVWAALERANTQLRAYGVEEITSPNSPDMQTLALYVNMGESYTPTIVYDYLADRFYVGGWADWLEWREKNPDYDFGT